MNLGLVGLGLNKVRDRVTGMSYGLVIQSDNTCLKGNRSKAEDRKVKRNRKRTERTGRKVLICKIDKIDVLIGR